MRVQNYIRNPKPYQGSSSLTESTFNGSQRDGLEGVTRPLEIQNSTKGLKHAIEKSFEFDIENTAVACT